MSRSILKKINILNMIKQYIHAHILFFAFFQIILNGFSKKGLEISNLAIENKILAKLRKKYKKEIQKYKLNPVESLINKKNTIWICWMQGMDNAPVLVKKCYESIKSNFKNYEIIIITEKNYKKWIDFPEYIVTKYEKGIITKTHLSDLIRIELLTKYGGTWVDATVLCTGGIIQNYLMESDLFMYQVLKPGLSGHPTRISSWFITANSNSNILNLTKHLLYKYWKKNNYMDTYFLLHHFIELSIENYQDEWNKVIKISNGLPHILQYKLNDEFDSEEWEILCNISPLHKLTYKNIDFNNIKNNSYLKKICN